MSLDRKLLVNNMLIFNKVNNLGIYLWMKVLKLKSKVKIKEIIQALKLII